MTPAAILELARRFGVEVMAADGRIGLRGPAEARARLRPLVERHKGELLALLTEQAANDEPAATQARTCRDCQHLTAAQTCARPVEAGLRPHFGIVWPGPTRAGACPAFVERQRPPAPDLPKPDPRLTGDNYVPANEQELERMLERTQRAERLGLPARDADTAADVLHARDRFGPHDMRLCCECRHIRADGQRWHCASLKGPIPTAWVTHQLQRCPDFKGVEP